MNLKDFLAGIEILKPHYKESDGYHLGADHDVIYLYPTDTPLNDDEVQQMKELGFCQDGADEDDYNVDESWWAYV